MEVNDPIDKDSIPVASDDSTAERSNRFAPAPLSRTTIACMQRSLVRNQLRRTAYRGGRLRAFADGEACWQFDADVEVYRPFRVPLSASNIEIYGEDDAGNLLLAVFPLPGSALSEGDRAQHLAVTLEGEQTVAIDIVLSDGVSGQVIEHIITISYTNAAKVCAPKVAKPMSRAITVVARR
jgi:hypothetical protein